MQEAKLPYVVVDLPDEEVTYIGFRWKLEGKDLRWAIEEVYSDICTRNGWKLIWDFQAVGKLVLNPGDINRFVNIVQAEVKPGCEPSRVILVTRDLMIKALARLYQHMSRVHNHPVVLAGTLTEASQYLETENFHSAIRQRVQA